MCIITHAISPLALRTGWNVPGWLSPPPHSTQGVQDHIAFLCYHPPAFPAPCNLCGVLQTLPSLSQVLPARTVLHVVIQMLSINAPPVKKKKKKKLCTMPPLLCLSMASYNSTALFYSQTSLYSILGNQQRRKATCCSAGTQSMHSISLSARLPSFIYDIKCISLHRTVLTWVKLPPCTGRCLLQHELQNQGQFL